ncbi:TIGR02452 family protein [Actinomadura macra]|uniref:TIGR02452 family protein n=1 Tax=Actinomadura macra TaxID=46164 RepID=UPI0008309844|nr:TIGR02452 family protein [Actinomadura macra]
MSTQPRRMIARETVDILGRGAYPSPSGRTVSVADRLARAVDGTVLYRPDELDALLTRLPPATPDAVTGAEAPTETPRETLIEVTDETTLAAAHRLCTPGEVPLALNFASAKNPGGGFLNGAHAQEEGLARSSGLFSSLCKVGEFYDFHRAQRDLLYSDHMIYSPDVPVFRDDSGRLLEEPYETAFLTSAAPNRGAIREPAKAERIPEVLALRVRKVLAVARANGHRRLVLGAWGCGVFRNDPHEVAEAFAAPLGPDGEFANHFEHVVFAVWDTAEGAPRLTAFQRTFA